MKSYFEISGDNIYSRAMDRIKRYLQLFKNKVVCKGNNPKTSKIHQMLRIVSYITRHGYPKNYDGSRGVTFGKLN